MKSDIKKYSLNSTEQDQQDMEFWNNQSFEYKLEVLETIRPSAQKLSTKHNNPYHTYNGDQQRLRRILRVIEQK